MLVGLHRSPSGENSVDNSHQKSTFDRRRRRACTFASSRRRGVVWFHMLLLQFRELALSAQAHTRGVAISNEFTVFAGCCRVQIGDNARNPNELYRNFAARNLEECREECAHDPDCFGFEFNTGDQKWQERCEIWNRAPDTFFSAVTTCSCFVKLFCRESSCPGDKHVCREHNACLGRDVDACTDDMKSTNFHCVCKSGLTGEDCTNHCDVHNGGCHDSAICTNTDGSRECTCPAGFRGDGISACEDIDECQENNGGCHDSAICTNTDGSRECICPVGFRGDGISACEDIDECLENNGGCHDSAICTNTDGSHECICKAGFSGNGVSCSDKNYCMPSSCGNHGKCIDKIAPEVGFTCICDEEYGGQFCQFAGIYEWVAQSWSSCTRLCGSGVMTREVHCLETMGPSKSKVGEQYCSSRPSPTSFQVCNAFSCISPILRMKKNGRSSKSVPRKSDSAAIDVEATGSTQKLQERHPRGGSTTEIIAQNAVIFLITSGMLLFCFAYSGIAYCFRGRLDDPVLQF